MRDSATLLNFKAYRSLSFDINREVDFDVKRNLTFDLDRALSFDLNRDLGIRKRGVIFRGYVCPVCGAAVAIDAPRCVECGVEFEDTNKKEEEVKKREWERKSSKKKKPSKKRSSKKKSSKKKDEFKETFQCPICSTYLYIGTGMCPTCGARFDSTLPPPPPQQNGNDNATVSWEEFTKRQNQRHY